MSTIEPTAAHEAYLEELKACLGSAGKDIPEIELLAVTAQFLGMLVALQDARTMTPSRAMQIIERNMAVGNRTVINGHPLNNPEGTS